MSDRICIHSNGKLKVQLSAENLVSCCSSCGFGCDGGHPLVAWQYWKHNGIVSGGNYGSKQVCTVIYEIKTSKMILFGYIANGMILIKGCQPYSFAPCEHFIHGPRPACNESASTPECRKRCDDGESYSADLYFGRFYFLISLLRY